ncbi:MAG: hypothetical protein KDN19_16820 [Verrucomicrobiae bacterium]|nr:hypothetical protein [Verrucomicrobiae bacterium]
MPTKVIPYPRGKNAERRYGVPRERDVAREAQKAEPAILAQSPVDGRVSLLAEETDLHTLEGRRMVFDRTSLDRVIAGTTGRLLAPLPDGSSLSIRFDRIFERNRTTQTLKGEVEGEPETSDVQFVYHDGIIHGTVARYDIDQHIEYRIHESGYMIVRELDHASMTQDCGGSPVDEELSASAGNPSPSNSTVQEEGSGEVVTDTSGYVTIDLVVGYGMQARAADGGYAQIEARIIASVDRMNSAFANSQVTQTEMMLLGTIEDPVYQYPGDVSGSMSSSDELGYLNNTGASDPELNAVSDYANELGADLKSFVIRQADGSAGIAYRPGTSSVTARDYMTSSRITFAHELGHNIGTYHSWGDSSSDSSTSRYAYGWRLDPPAGTRVRTIMAYDWGWGNGTRIPYYSNPAVEYQNARTGQVNGYNATGDTESDQRYVSGGYLGTLGTGFNGTHPGLGARNGPFILEEASGRAVLRTRTPFDVQVPTPGATWTQGDLESITWSGADYSHTVSVDLYKGGVFVTNLGSGYSGIKRTQSIAVPTGLPAGNDFMIRVTLNGTQTADSGLFTIIGDSPPSSQPDLLSSSDSGALNFDNVTNIQTPTFTGQDTPGTLVTLSSNLDGVIGTGTTNGAGIWIITASTLGNGPHQIVASTTAGGPSLPLPVTIDTIAPAAPNSLTLLSSSDSGISNTDRITNESRPRIQGNAESGTSIDLFLEGSPVASGTAISGSFQIPANVSTEGVLDFSARATDLAGNAGPVSAAVSVEFDFTPPPPPGAPMLSAASDSGDSNSDLITNIATPVITGSGIDGQLIRLTANDVLVGSGSVSGGTWTITTDLLEDGINTLAARQEDEAGNLSSPGLSLDVTIDRTRPSAPSDFSLASESDRGFSDSDGLTNVTTPVFEGHAEVGTTVRIFRAGSIEIASGVSDGWFSQASTSLPLGSHSVTARCFDIAGNSSLTTPPIALVIDTIPPSKVFSFRLDPSSDSGVSNSDLITNDLTPKLGGFSLFESGGTRVHIFVDGIDVYEQEVNANWLLDLPAQSDGTKSVVAYIEDAAGNFSVASDQTLEIQFDSTPPPAPFDLGLTPETDTGTSTTDAITKNTSPVIMGSSEPGEVELFQDGNPIGTVLSDGSWSLATSNLPEGVTTFSARQSDLAGNDGNLSAPLEVTIDVTAPNSPSMPSFAAGEDTGTDATDGLTNHSTPTFTGDAEPGTLVVLFDSEGNAIGQGVANSPWMITTDPLPDGNHEVTASASDSAGNLSPLTEAMGFVIDSTPPSVTIDQGPTQADPTIEEPVDFVALFSEAVTGFNSDDVDIDLDGTLIGGAASVADGGIPGREFEISVAGMTGEGVITASIPPGSAMDAAGNLSLASTSNDNEITKKEVPGPVGGVDATDGDFPDKIVVTWTDSGASTFRIFRHPFRNPSAASEVGSVGTGVSMFEDSGVTPDLAYFYWVRAEDEDGVGDFGNPDPGLADSGTETKGTDTPIVEAGTPAADPLTTWNDEASGLYDGLLRDAGDEYTILGGVTRLSLSRARNGSGLGGPFSASLCLDSRKAVIRGVMDDQGRFQGEVRQRDGSMISCDLQLYQTTANQGEIIRGTVSWGDITTVAELPRLEPGPTAPNGLYTMILPALPGRGATEPGGDGWSTVSINPRGMLRLVGILGDGTRFTESACLSSEDEFSLYTWLYRPSAGERGHFGGRIVFRDLDPDISDFDGVTQWKKPADPREPRYPDGFDIEVWALGSAYEKPAPGQPALTSLADDDYNACLTMSGPSGPEGGAMEKAVTWMSNHQIVFHGPERLRASVSATNGGLNGFWFDPDSRQRWPFSGVVFQSQQIAVGHFLNVDTSGGLRFAPSTDTPYPGSEDPGLRDRPDVPDPPADAPDLTDANWDAAAAGRYAGLTSMGEPNGGLLSLILARSGVVSGVFEIDGERRAFRGSLDENGHAQFTIPRGGTTDGVVELQLKSVTDILEDSYQLAGTIELDGNTHNLDAQRRPNFNRNERCPQEGLYNLVMLAPDGADSSIEPAGDGCGNLRVNFLGSCSGLFTLADGTRTPLTGHVSRSAEWSLYRPLHGGRGRGYLAGKLAFRGTTGDPSQVDGLWHWEKGANVSRTIYPAGVSATLGVVGNAWTPVPRGEIALPGLTDNLYNAWVRFLGPGLGGATSADFAITWQTSNRIVYYGPERLIVNVNPRTGLVTGRLIDRPDAIVFGFKGVVLPSQEIVSGAYLSGGESGLFSIEKR